MQGLSLSPSTCVMVAYPKASLSHSIQSVVATGRVCEVEGNAGQVSRDWKSEGLKAAAAPRHEGSKHVRWWRKARGGRLGPLGHGLTPGIS